MAKRSSVQRGRRESEEHTTRVLITGAAGFLGRHFTKYLHDKADSLELVDNLSSPYSKWADVPMNEFGAHTLASAMDLQSMLASDHYHDNYLTATHKKVPFDAVYHFAAPVGGREKIEGDPLFNAESLEIDSQLFRWVASLDNKPVVVYPSSSAVYPADLQARSEKQYPMVEDYFEASGIYSDGWNMRMWGVPDEMYGFTKLAGEMLAYKAAKYGVNTLCIRPFSGYGEGQGPDYPMTALVRRALANEDPFVVWGSGEQVRDWVHVDDIVEAVEARLQAGVDGYQTLNICTGVGTTFYELAEKIRDTVAADFRIVADSNRPEGVRYRLGSTTKLSGYYTPTVSLNDGIKRVVAYERGLIDQHTK